jgi:hypothetical protein
VAELDRATEGVGPAPVVQSPPDTAVDDLEERMRMLGYL